ncbi:endo-1,4-beta-xylanase A precursor [Lachnospiraceae bacterium KM106-2]|nr:endo-1,4-beta-xylanase A precursor [Lachnospiraceae bacterium KM106-2]
MKRFVSILCIGALLLTGCSSSSSTESTSSEITLESGQSLLIGKVTAISGNEVTFDIATEKQMSGGNGMPSGKDSSSSDSSDSSDSSSKKSQSDSTSGTNNNSSSNSNSTSQKQSGSNNMQGGMGGGGNSAGNMPSGDMPQGGGNMPGGGGPDMQSSDSGSSSSDSSTKSSKSDQSDSSNSGKTQRRSMVTYETTGESKTLQIPVGTTVTTLLGTKTTFSRIAADNVIKMVTEKNADGKTVVVAVYIVQ